VTVIAVNVEPSSPASTDRFIQTVGFELVANDYAGVAYTPFGRGSASLYVIINGVANSPTHKQWELLYRANSFSTAASLRTIIDRVKPAGVAPQIATQPASQTATAGGNVTLSVIAQGSDPVSYQWRFNGTALAGATASTLALTNVQPAQAGEYSVVLSNSFGAVTSASAMLTIIVRPEVPPNFSAFRRQTDGAIEFTLKGESGRNYRIEVSTDLARWNLLTRLAGLESGATYRDPDSPGLQWRFYRAVRE
jgi:hypothetical protein